MSVGVESVCKLRSFKPRRTLHAWAAIVGALWLSSSTTHSSQRGGSDWGVSRDGQAAEFSAVLVRNIVVPMRDGTGLATDVYFPGRDGKMLPGPWPVVIERTPYSKTYFWGNAPDGNYYAEHGYVWVVQDVRGRYLSEGTFGSYDQEGDDGLDTFNWARSQPWSNGKVAVTGSSYFAATAEAILVQHPPGLAAAIIRVGSGNYHEDGAWRGGAFLLAHNVNYSLSLAATGKEAASTPALGEALKNVQKTENAYMQMVGAPARAGASPFALAPSYERWYLDWQNHELYDAYWKKNGNGFVEHYRNAPDVPVLLISEWYDAFLGGILDGFAGFSEGRKSPVQLIVGPGEHGSVYSLRTSAGDVDFGPSSPIHVQIEMMRWLDQYLKGADRGLKPGKAARLFRIEGGDGTKTASGHLKAGGTWHEFTDWPPSDSRLTKYYLGSDLSLRTAIPDRASLTYSYDPRHPLPSVGGRISSGGQMVPAGPYDQRCSKKIPECADDLPLNFRADVLSFTTPPLERDTEVTGQVSSNLWISSSAVDTDFTATLIDQYPPTPDYPDGYAMNLETGIVRARLRSFTQAGPKFHRVYGIKEEPLQPGTVYPVTIDLWGVSYLFRSGHRIRLDISSSSFPRYDANPNTGEPFAVRKLPPVVARNTIYLGSEHPSSITLPVR